MHRSGRILLEWFLMIRRTLSRQSFRPEDRAVCMSCSVGTDNWVSERMSCLAIERKVSALGKWHAHGCQHQRYGYDASSLGSRLYQLPLVLLFCSIIASIL